jgi:hypothetical protein
MLAVTSQDITLNDPGALLVEVGMPIDIELPTNPLFPSWHQMQYLNQVLTYLYQDLGRYLDVILKIKL